MSEDDPVPPPNRLVGLFGGLTVFGLAGAAMTYALPLVMGADVAHPGGYTRTIAIGVTVVGLLGLLLSGVWDRRGRR